MGDSRSRSGRTAGLSRHSGSTSRNRAGPSLCRGIALSIDDNYRSADAERCNFVKLVRGRAIVYKVIPERSIGFAPSDVHVAILMHHRV